MKEKELKKTIDCISTFLKMAEDCYDCIGVEYDDGEIVINMDDEVVFTFLQGRLFRIETFTGYNEGKKYREDEKDIALLKSLLDETKGVKDE